MATEEAQATRVERTFKSELEALVNRYSKENGSDTPDWVLAVYLEGCLAAFDAAVRERERWYGRDNAGPGRADPEVELVSSAGSG